MKPAVKYALGRLGLFLVVFAVLIPTTPLNILVKAMAMLRRRLLIWHQEAHAPSTA